MVYFGTFLQILAVSTIIGMKKDVVIDIGIFSTHVYNNIFFYSDNRKSQNLKKSAILGSNFGVLVGPIGAKNQKMVLTNAVQDGILYLNMKNQHMLQKFPYPSKHTIQIQKHSQP